MGWFSKSPEPTEAEKAQERIDYHRSSARSGRHLAETWSDLGAKKLSRDTARNAELHDQDADELESEGRVRGWW